MAKTFVHLPDYEILERLGRGAGAIIYSARRRGDGRKVAVKHVVRHGPQDDRFIEQAENEYEVARQLDHPYLRKCLDLVRVRRWLKVRELFLIMELVEGHRLDELYEHQRPQQLEQAVRIFIRIAEGLAAMHKAGFVHGDIKPRNVFMLDGGAIKIFDFGQSCPIGHAKTRIQGTPDFIAPEQVLRQPLDQRTDIFNLGATMYWVLTGKAWRTMLSGASPGQMKQKLDARRANDPPHVVNPSVPLALSRLVSECCEHDKDQRPWNMHTVISRLETVLHVLDRQSAATAGEQAVRSARAE